MKCHVRHSSGDVNAGRHTSVAFADDAAAVIAARNPMKAQRKLIVLMYQILTWLRDHGLILATEKTEFVLFTRSHILLEIPMHVCRHHKITRRSTNYLGL